MNDYHGYCCESIGSLEMIAGVGMIELADMVSPVLSIYPLFG
jgi:hypothetical protein